MQIEHDVEVVGGEDFVFISKQSGVRFPFATTELLHSPPRSEELDVIVSHDAPTQSPQEEHFAEQQHKLSARKTSNKRKKEKQPGLKRRNSQLDGSFWQISSEGGRRSRNSRSRFLFSPTRGLISNNPRNSFPSPASTLKKQRSSNTNNSNDSASPASSSSASSKKKKKKNKKSEVKSPSSLLDGAFWQLPSSERRRRSAASPSSARLDSGSPRVVLSAPRSPVHDENDEEERGLSEESQHGAAPVPASGSYLLSALNESAAYATNGQSVVDVKSGDVILDGAYWMVDPNAGRSRRKRQLQFFPEDHLPEKSSRPARVLTEEERCALKERQRALTRERRAEREQRQAREARELEDLLQFLSKGREIIPGLYLGGRLAAENTEWLLENIDYVYNFSGKSSFEYTRKMSPNKFEIISIADNAHENLSAYFESSSREIEKLLQQHKNVFIHCWQGKSRSVSILLAYLVSSKNMTLRAAFNMVEEKNRGTNINPGFMQQLMAWERALNPQLRESTLRAQLYTRVADRLVEPSAPADSGFLDY